MQKSNFFCLLSIILSSVSTYEHPATVHSSHIGIKSRKDRKLQLGMGLAAMGGLAGGALIGSLLNKPGENEESLVMQLRQDFTVENGFFMHYSVERGATINQLITYTSKVDKELTDFQTDCTSVIEDMKSAINNAGQIQNRHINKMGSDKAI